MLIDSVSCILTKFYCLTWEKVTLSHLVSVVQIPSNVTLPRIICGSSCTASQLIIPVPFDALPDSRAQTLKLTCTNGLDPYSSRGVNT